MTTACPNCGSPVAAGERFCGECGTDVAGFRQQQQSQPAIVPPAQQPPQPQVRQPMPGYPGSVAPTGPYPQQQSSNPMLIIGLILLAVGVLGCLGTLALGYASSTTEVGAEADSIVAGGYVCAFGILFLLGVPGAILAIVGRMRK